MGVNLGAAIAPLLCGYIGETYDWHWGFGLATFGMLVGVAIFVAPRAATQILILSDDVRAAGGAAGLSPRQFPLGGHECFCGRGAVRFGRGGHSGPGPRRSSQLRPAPRRTVKYLTEPVLGPINRAWMVYLGTLLAIVLFVLLVSGFAPLTKDRRPISLICEDTLKSMEPSDSPAVRSLGVIAKESSRPAGIVLFIAGLLALGYLVFEMVRLQRIARHRMYVVLILTFFSMVFWTFFEQAGSSINNFTDRNVNRFVGTTTSHYRGGRGQDHCHRADAKATGIRLERLRGGDGRRRGQDHFGRADGETDRLPQWRRGLFRGYLGQTSRRSMPATPTLRSTGW